MSTRLGQLLARMIRVTTIVDRAARRFDQARSAVVTRFAPASALEAYNDLAYGGTPVYLAGSPGFRHTLFNWEAEAIARVFPGPPGRILIGGAGGGREAFALAARGYEIAAFEPSATLAQSMAEHPLAGVTVDAFVGRYEDLPMLTSAGTVERLDVRQLGPFDGAIFGWASFSHLRTRAARVEALRKMGEVTNGPILVSFYTRRPRVPTSSGPLQAAARALGFQFDGDLFAPAVGFFHLSAPDELEAEAHDAGVGIVHASFDELDGCWPYLIVQRVNAPRQNALTSSRQDPTVARSGESART